MKVFGIGLSRTGTLSLTVALERLGFSAKHYPKAYAILDEANRYDALTDIPVILAYRELDRLYPSARFILTLRDLGDWLDSCARFWNRKPHERRGKVPRIVRRAVYGRVSYNREAFRDVYWRHLEDARLHFDGRPNKLLTLNIVGGEGYEKLCPFLGLPDLDEPFPHENKG